LRQNFDGHKQAIVGGMLLMGFSFILILSLASPNQGQLTAALAQGMRTLFGWAGLVFPLVLVGIGFYLVLWGMEQAPQLPRSRLIGLGLLFLVFSAFATLVVIAFDNGLNDVWAVAGSGTGGGYVGGLLLWPLLNFTGWPFSVLVLMLLGLVAAALLFGLNREDVRQTAAWTQAQLENVRAGGEAGAEDREIPVNTGRSVRSIRPHPAQSSNGPPPSPPEPVAGANDGEAPAPATTRRKPQRSPEEPTREAAAPEPVFIAPDPGGNRPAPNWKLPVMADLLEPGRALDNDNNFIRQQVEIIEHTLESFGAPAKVVEINQGPTVTQFGVEPQFITQRSGKRTKVKVGKIASLADDLALALEAYSVRVQAPVPGKGYVGLEIPNSHKALVSLRDVMESTEFQRIKSPLRLGLGENVAGLSISTDLAKMPHLLIAGATGSGKSVCMNSIICCLLLQNTPEDLRMVMVDPKRVELTNYNGIPHLVAPVVVETERVIGTLQWALREMDSRYKRLAEAGVRNIVEYNKMAQRRRKRKLPYIIIFIDELADLMMLSPEETERGVTRLAQMARATGIHMVIATQRPSVDVVTGLIKANFPARIAFAVASSTDSRVILDTVGAERLLGQGDMLFQSPDASAPLRLQGCWLSEREINDIIEYWRGARRFNLISTPDSQTQPDPTPVEEKLEAATQKTGATETAKSPVYTAPTPVVETPPAAAPADEPAAPPEPEPPPLTTLPPPTQQPLWEDLIEQAAEEPEYDDELYPEAVKLVRELNRASTSMLQRRFRIGYTRAARLMDAMEEAGIIGPPTGTSKAREVLPAGDGEPTENS
jgi:S-DNA-T family DNA segregation ATPase FtsK/SpoIIIE